MGSPKVIEKERKENIDIINIRCSPSLARKERLTGEKKYIKLLLNVLRKLLFNH